jgi:hypothetical protein
MVVIIWLQEAACMVILDMVILDMVIPDMVPLNMVLHMALSMALNMSKLTGGLVEVVWVIWRFRFSED